MGQTLSYPNMDKKGDEQEGSRFAYAGVEMQGWRITMEDDHAAVLDLDAGNSNAFFAVYDGHGGSTVAKYAGGNLHKVLIETNDYKQEDYEKALKQAFLDTDEGIKSKDPKDPSGCTAVAALVTEDKIYVANAGDSRAVLSVKGEVKPLSVDHKPTNEAERNRIVQAGGYVEYGRVNGNLALSRALGDFEFKKNVGLTPEAQIITAVPEVECHDITEEDEFLVLACDGIWDCLSSQQVVDCVRYLVSRYTNLKAVGDMICDHCLAPDTTSGAGIGCDNMTILIIALLQGRTKEEWFSWMTDRYQKKYGYETPDDLPPLYSQSRIMAFRSRMQAHQEASKSGGNNEPSLAGTGLSSFARILGSAGGIAFHPGAGRINDGGPLMFSPDSEDEDEDEGIEASSQPSDPIRQLRDHLVEFERHSDGERDLTMSDASETRQELQGEAPLPPKNLSNGDIKVPVPPVQQLHSQPAADGIKAEGFLDASEDPLRSC